MSERILASAGELINEIRTKRPLIHHITNYVTVNDCANIVLAIGGSPIMADACEEVEVMVSISSALVINIGTLNARTIEAMIRAGKQANKLNIPVIFDPVGVGASDLRTQATQQILSQVKISVLRGNMSEIKCISGLSESTRGVDASDADLNDGEEQGAAISKSLAQKLDCVVAITGAIDIISDGSRTCWIANGNPMMARITGTGCMCTSLIGAFGGVSSDYYSAAVAAVASMGVAGEIGFEVAGPKGTGSFRAALVDAVCNLNADTFLARVKIDEATY